MRWSQLSKGNVGLLVALAFLAAVAIWFATGSGIGVTPDSTVYIDAAQNLLNGRGLVALTASGELKPLTHYPPLYPSVLALVGLFGLSIETAARLLNAFLFGANVLLVGIALRRFSRESFWLPILGALLTLTAPDIAGIHTFALSEGLFIFLAISGLVSLARFLETKRRAWLVASAGFIGLAVLTRYVGVALVFAGVFALLFVNGRDLRRRFFDAVNLGLIACAPMGLWTIRTAHVAQEAIDRRVIFHPITLRQIISGLSTASSWLLLGKVRKDYRVIFFVIEVLVAALFVISLLRKTRVKTLAETDNRDRAATGERIEHREGRDLSRLPVVLLLFIVSHVGFLIFTAFFIDADTVLDDRALVPVHVAAIMLVCGFAWKLFASLNDNLKGNRAIRIALVILAMIFTASYSLRGGRWFLQVRQDGQVYASRAWKESETIARVKNLPSGVPIYSNGYDAIYYLSGRPAIYVPEKTNHNTGRPNENYEKEVAKMRRDLEQGNAVLVYFKTLPERWFLPSEAELVQRLRPRSVKPTVDGSIFSGAE
jgi:hypothetical protein